jgi:lambda family phage portal protein
MIKLSDELHIPTMREILAEPAKKPQKRQYAAARLTKQNADWTTVPWSANYDLYRNLRILRARARQMAKDAPHFKKFLGMVRTNVIGPKGLKLQSRARLADGGLDTALNKRVEEAFWAWSFAENCSASGKLDWMAAQNLFVTQLARDGEVLVQHVRQGPFGYQLKFINVDYLDETFTQDLGNGNRIIMSVEIDANDRPVAYWLTTPASDINFTRGRARHRTRVPASEIIHAFLVFDDESQIRGVTWFHAGLLEGKNLEGYKNGVITSAKMAALNMGFLQREVPDEVEFSGADDEEGREQVIDIDVRPASFTELPVGTTLAQFDPKQPTQNHTEFKKGILADLASAFGLCYFSLAGDMSAVNYSSARVGLGEERDIWRSLQDFVAANLCRGVYHEWLRAASLSGKLKLTAKEFAEVMNPMWRPRGWRYVDPQKEIEANVSALENKLTTWTDVLAEQGVDITEHFETIKAEQELAKQYGIDLTAVTKTTATEPGPTDPNADTKTPPATDSGRGYTNGEYRDDIVN